MNLINRILMQQFNLFKTYLDEMDMSTKVRRSYIRSMFFRSYRFYLANAMENNTLYDFGSTIWR